MLAFPAIKLLACTLCSTVAASAINEVDREATRQSDYDHSFLISQWARRNTSQVVPVQSSNFPTSQKCPLACFENDPSQRGFSSRLRLAIAAPASLYIHPVHESRISIPELCWFIRSSQQIGIGLVEVISFPTWAFKMAHHLAIIISACWINILLSHRETVREQSLEFFFNHNTSTIKCAKVLTFSITRQL